MQGSMFYVLGEKGSVATFIHLQVEPFVTVKHNMLSLLRHPVCGGSYLQDIQASSFT